MGMMINRRRAYGGKKLPYDAEIEYLESTGTQYIKTGILTSQNINFDIQCFVNQSTTGVTFFGARRQAAGQDGVQLGTAGNLGGTIRFDYGTRVEGNIIVVNRLISAHNDGKTLYYNNSSLVCGAGNVSRNIEIILFGMNTAGTAVCLASRIYKCSFYDNSILVRDYIPVRVGTTGYMYDKVSKQLFGNSGTGNFILGPDK